MNNIPVQYLSFCILIVNIIQVILTIKYNKRKEENKCQ